MSTIVTSYCGLFDHGIERVRIPRLQRDYAQGRADEATKRIRGAFVEVLHGALTGGPPVGLDFVFGDVTGGVLSPLDGQQRLTTLFLLHWYLAARAGRLDEKPEWKRFTYETRASARLFCERLGRSPAPPSTETPSQWISDQSWFLSTWRHDPTVTSMLRMIDDLHKRFGAVDAAQAWVRLVDPVTPAISFHLLPIADMGRPDDLYIKMNSRGKPLTPFENFKAVFEQSLPEASRKAFAEKVDGAWSDMLWPMRGDDNVIDDEFMRYLEFVAEVCAWRGGAESKGDTAARVEAAFGAGNVNANANLDFLFAAFDVWCATGESIESFFVRHFTLDDHQPGKVAIYGTRVENRVDLLAACCRIYGDGLGQNRAFTLQRTLLLYATVLHRVNKTADFPRRIRVLRNAIEATGDLTPSTMPARVKDVERYIASGNLADISHFNARQIEDERRKEDFLQKHPDLADALFALENHPLLRGSLTAFALDAATFAQRAATFRDVFADASLYPTLTGALLACGDYSQRYLSDRFRIGGTDERTEPWRALFVSSNVLVNSGTGAALMTLLDDVAGEAGPMADRLDAVRETHLAALATAQEFDWRYHLARRPEMRRGVKGIYVGSGYSLCALNKITMGSKHWDPYLYAMRAESKVPTAHVMEPRFEGYVARRPMLLPRSGTTLRSVEVGIELSPPADLTQRVAFDAVCAKHGVDPTTHLLAMPQVARNGRLVDTVDRVALGAALLRDLVAADC